MVPFWKTSWCLSKKIQNESHRLTFDHLKWTCIPKISNGQVWITLFISELRHRRNLTGLHHFFPRALKLLWNMWMRRCSWPYHWHIRGCWWVNWTPWGLQAWLWTLHDGLHKGHLPWRVRGGQVNTRQVQRVSQHGLLKFYPLIGCGGLAFHRTA